MDIKGCGASDCRETACATFRKSKITEKVNHGKENQYSGLTKCSETADNRASDRIRRETAGT